MKIITLWQPWASLIALGLKQYETRSWSTNYRGKLLIHAAKRPYKSLSDEEAVALKACDLAGFGEYDRRRLDFFGQIKQPNKHIPLGAIVAVADLTDCEMILPTVIYGKSKLEQAVGDWDFYRYAWKLENIKALPEPISYKGGQGLRNVDPGIIQVIEKETSQK